MKFHYRTYHNPTIFELKIVASEACKVFVIVEDPTKANTQYTNRFKKMKPGVEETFFLRMPQSPFITQFNISSDKGDSAFKIKSRSAHPLIPKMQMIDFGDVDIIKFIKFSQEFSEKAGWLSAGQYLSDDKTGDFEIHYLPTIKGITGKELNTPARINSKTGIVQVSKSQFQQFTVPGRFIILLHEFCHVFANKNMKDEIEADMHASQIYLAMGYPKVDLLSVFANVFLYSDTALNRERFKKLDQYARNFDEVVQSVRYL